jgi:hypothetical protein
MRLGVRLNEAFSPRSQRVNHAVPQQGWGVTRTLGATIMHGLTKLALSIAMLGGTIAAAHANIATAAIRADGPGRYDAHQPCHYYVNRNLPGPKRCTRFFSNALGPDVYVRYGFVFRNHDSFVQFRKLGWFKEQAQAAAMKKQVRLAAKKEQARLAAKEKQAQLAANEEQVRLAAKEEQARLAVEKEQARLAAKEERARLAAQETRERNEMQQHQVRLAREEHRAARVKESLHHEHALRLETKKKHVASRQTRLREHGKARPEDRVRLAATEHRKTTREEARLQEQKAIPTKARVRLAAKEEQQHVSGKPRAQKEISQAAGPMIAKDTEARARQEKRKPEEQVRLAAREDRSPASKEDHVRQQDQAQQPEKPGEDADRDEDEGSGGAARGDVARDSSSGGASHGATVDEKKESGGAGHGKDADQGSSGGASGY